MNKSIYSYTCTNTTFSRLFQRQKIRHNYRKGFSLTYTIFGVSDEVNFS